MLDACRADLARNRRLGGALGAIPVLIYRLGRWAHGSSSLAAVGARPVYAIVDMLWNKLLIGCELPHTAVIGPGLALPHAGRGVIVNGAAVIGDDVILMHYVTIGQGRDGRPPMLGDRVVIGIKATVLGATVGDESHVGAHALVLRDVPAKHRAVGVPAAARPLDDGAVEEVA